MIEPKLFLYDSSKPNYKGTDLSEYILIGQDYTDLINEELDTYEITLSGMNSDYAEEFAPTTKFIFELYQDNMLYKDFHIEVSEDLVSKQILADDNYFVHNISFIDPAVSAQKRPVDNISITYKLKDVKLDTTSPNIDVDAKGERAITNIDYAENSTHGGTRPYPNGTINISRGFCKNEKKFKWVFTQEEKEVWNNLKYYVSISDSASKTITIPIPKLEVLNGVRDSSSFSHMGYCSVDVLIQDTNIVTGQVENSQLKVIHPTRNEVSQWDVDWVFYWLYGFTESTVPEDHTKYNGFIVNTVRMLNGWTGVPKSVQTCKRIAMGGYGDETVRSIDLEVKPNHKYDIRLSLHDFTNESSPDPNFTYDNGPAVYSFDSYCEGFLQYNSVTAPSLPVNRANLTAEVSQIGYSTTMPIDIFHSAPPVSAYDLFVKCQIATQKAEKIYGENIKDKKLTYYLAPQDKEKLQNTTIVENFYNQKNLWQMFIEIGKYIHSIPEIRFGEDDRYIVSWRPLGQTEQNENKSYPLSIYNSRKVDNYISAVTSYVDNAVQLGGLIDEWVAPKSQSDDLLVYNDTAVIMTSKNIIEIVDFEVMDTTTKEIKNLAGNGETQYINGFIFAKEIYNVLSIEKLTSSQQSTGLAINKSYALYYELGTNVIAGLNYRLPVESAGSGEDEYAIKKIIGLVFGKPTQSWKDIKINNYVFHIQYRTKDSMRSDQSRPDLRKYLLNSKYDEIPLHNQFNNQEDILIDTQKLGNNIYGKLIKTGNTEYNVVEWSENLAAVKHSGELYNIYGNLYYVSKTKNTIYPDHVISNVTLTKDYNQLSEIIGIPSEPRFYEISERSTIKREVVFNDYIYMGTTHNPKHFAKFDKLTDAWRWISNMLFGKKDKSKFPKYVITTFKNDANNLYGDVVGSETFYLDICSPLNVYTMQNTITMEWDMRDNFSAGDKVGEAEIPKTTDKSYRTLQAVRYKDVFGRSDMVDYTILKDLDLTPEQIRNLPESPISTRYETEFNVAFVYGLPNIVDGKVIDTAFENRLTTTVTDTYGVGRVPEGHKVEIYTYEDTADVISNKRYYVATFIGIIENVYKWDINVVSKTPIVYEWDKRLMSSRDDTQMDNQHGIALMLDNREVFGGNYNLQVLTDSDRYVLSAYLWRPKTTVKFAFLREEINKISNDTIPTTTIMQEVDIYVNDGIDNTLIDVIKDDTGNPYGIQIHIDKLIEKAAIRDLIPVKAMAFIDTALVNGVVASGNTYFICGRNVGNLSENGKKEDWYISDINKDFFKKQ